MQDYLLIAIIINSFLYGTSTLLRKYLVDKRNIETIEYLVITMFVKALILSVLYFFIDDKNKKLMSPQNLINKFKNNYNIFIPIKVIDIAAFFIFIYVLKSSKLSWSIPLFAITKILITVLLSILIFSDKITPYRCIGLFLGFISIYMLK